MKEILKQFIEVDTELSSKYYEFLKNLVLVSVGILTAIILLTDIEKQNEIAEHIQNLRTQAKQLQTEATEVLEQAKQQVEKQIIKKLNTPQTSNPKISNLFQSFGTLSKFLPVPANGS